MYYIIPAIQNIWTHFLCFCYKTWNASSLIRFIQNKYLRRVLQFKPHRDDQKYRIFPAYRTHIINHTRTAHNSIVLNSAPQFVDYMRLCGDNAPFWWDSIFIIITSCRWDLMCEGYVSFLRLVLGFGYLSRIMWLWKSGWVCILKWKVVRAHWASAAVFLHIHSAIDISSDHTVSGTNAAQNETSVCARSGCGSASVCLFGYLIDE